MAFVQIQRQVFAAVGACVGAVFFSELATRSVMVRRSALAASLSMLMAAPAASGQGLEEAVDRAFADIDADGAGCAVGVIHEGEYRLKKGYGMANLEHDVPITTATVFRTGSVSKQFTAFAVALLAERGSLDLDAEIHDYLPDLLDYDDAVTVRQMVHHVAGMGDYDPQRFTKADGTPFRFGNEDYWTIDEFYAAVRTTPLALPPGKEWRYSNLAYFLLGQLVERVSGKTLRQFAAAEIFEPLGMSNSFFNDNVNQPVRHRADGYRSMPTGDYEIFMTNLDWVGDGGVYTSLDDFIAWDRNFYDNRLGRGGKRLIEMTTSPLGGVIARRHDHFGDAGYAFGHFVGRYRGAPVVYHSGGWVAFSSLYVRFPDQQLSTVVFCNTTEHSAPELGERVALAAFEIYAD